MEHVGRLQVDQRLLVLDEVQVVDGEQVVAGVELAVGAGIAHHPLELPAGDLGQRAAPSGRRLRNLMLGPGPHLVEGDEDQDRGRDDRPDHLEPLAAVEVLGLADRLALGVELVGEAVLGPDQDDLRADEDDAR